jgi:RHS repeat-associated protein
LIESVYYTQGQGLISQRRNNASYFYHYDGLGSTKALTDANQNIQSSTIYDAWGNILQSSGTITNPYLYVGELGYYGDGDAGMYLLTQRWYNPAVGRFGAKDPLSLVGKSYFYCASNPLTRTDRSGLMWDANYCVESFSRCVNTAGAGESVRTVWHSCTSELIRGGGCLTGCVIIGSISGSLLGGVCFVLCYLTSAGVEIAVTRTSPSYRIELESCCTAFRWCCKMVRNHNWPDELGLCSETEVEKEIEDLAPFCAKKK